MPFDNPQTYGEYSYDFNPDSEYSFFGDPLSDQNPNTDDAWLDFSIGNDPYTGDTQYFEPPPSFFETVIGSVEDFVSNSWDSISGIFTQGMQQIQASSSNTNSSSINPLFLLIGAYLLLRK